jgi:hypothetical protein
MTDTKNQERELGMRLVVEGKRTLTIGRDELAISGEYMWTDYSKPSTKRTCL